jgi:hypothetical protein
MIPLINLCLFIQNFYLSQELDSVNYIKVKNYKLKIN